MVKKQTSQTLFQLCELGLVGLELSKREFTMFIVVLTALKLYTVDDQGQKFAFRKTTSLYA